MRIKGIKISKQSQYLTVAVDELIRTIFKLFFWVSVSVSIPGYFKLYELIKPYFN